MRKINDGLTKHERYRKNNPENALARYRRHYEKYKATKQAYAKRQYQANPAKAYFYNVQARYGVDEELYREMLVAQGECCAICGKHFSEQKRRPSIDHDHQTGKLRALLCGPCNVKVGVFEHSLAPKIRDYLERYSLKKAQ